MSRLHWRRVFLGMLFIVLGCGILFATRDTSAQNPNGPPGLTGRRVPPTVSSLDFKQLQYLRTRDIVELNPVRVSYLFDAALRNPQRFQREAIEAASNILRNAPGSPQAAIADAYAVVTQFRVQQGRVDETLQQQLTRITAQYPFSPAVAVAFQTICEDLIARREPQIALDLLDHAKSNAVNDQQKQWFSGYAESIRKAGNLPAQEDSDQDAEDRPDDEIDNNANEAVTE